MKLNFSWQSPMVSSDLRNEVEALVKTLAPRAKLLAGRQRILINFAADIPAQSPLVATIEDAQTGHLLGALETPREGLAIRFVALERMDARILLSNC